MHTYLILTLIFGTLSAIESVWLCYLEYKKIMIFRMVLTTVFAYLLWPFQYINTVVYLIKRKTISKERLYDQKGNI